MTRPPDRGAEPLDRRVRRLRIVYYDQDTGTFTFSSVGVIRIVADMHAVGSTSAETGTWLWAWDNPSILPAVKRRMDEVRRLGEQRDYSLLTMAVWRGGDEHGRLMTAIAMYVLRAKASTVALEPRAGCVRPQEWIAS